MKLEPKDYVTFLALILFIIGIFIGVVGYILIGISIGLAFYENIVDYFKRYLEDQEKTK